MNTIDKHFESFVDFLEAEAEAGNSIPDFKDVCEKLGFPENEMNAFLEETYGVGGDVIVESCRTSTPITMLP